MNVPSTSNNRITVGKPATEPPRSHRISVCAPSTTAKAANASPTRVTRCNGAEVNEVSPLTASESPGRR